MTLRVAGDADVPPCGDRTCVLCTDAGDGSTWLRREPIEAARELAQFHGVRVAHLEAPIGFDAPVGRRYGVEELGRAIEGLAVAIAAGDEALDDEPRGMMRQELRRALAVFRAGRAHHRPVVLEV